MLTIFSDGSQLLPLCDDIDVDIYVINDMLAMIKTKAMIMIIMLTIMTKAPTNFSEGGQLLPASDQAARAGDAVALAGHLPRWFYNFSWRNIFSWIFIVEGIFWIICGTWMSPAASILQLYKFTLEGIFSTTFRQKSTSPKAMIVQSKASQRWGWEGRNHLHVGDHRLKKKTISVNLLYSIFEAAIVPSSNIYIFVSKHHLFGKNNYVLGGRINDFSSSLLLLLIKILKILMLMLSCWRNWGNGYSGQILTMMCANEARWRFVG